MENFIGSVIFVLPGFVMYVFIQSFGVQSVTKHNGTELALYSALLWFPVAYISLAILNLINSTRIWTLTEIGSKSGEMKFLLGFFLISLITSLALSIVYAKFIFPIQTFIINAVRKWRKLAPLSDSPSVWDEVFGGNIEQVVNISKIDKQSDFIIGELEKVPRPFESEKCFYLRYIDLFTRLVSEYDIPITNIFVDTKSGICIKIYDKEALEQAIKKDSASGES